MRVGLMINWIRNLFKHRHKWETTHTNRWQHPTRQKCRCGVVRNFVWKENADEIFGMPWDKGEWLDSEGVKYNYDVLT